MGIIEKILKQLEEQKISGNPLIGTIAADTIKATDVNDLQPYVHYPVINLATTGLLLSANQSILIQAYKLVKGKSSSDQLVADLQQVREHALNLKQRIDVYFLLNKRNGMAALATGKYFDPEYSDQLSIIRELSHEDNPYFHIHCGYHAHQGFASLHSKFIIVDGKAAMVRGCDFGDGERFETSIIVKGGIVASLVANFCEGWNLCENDKISPESFIPYAVELKNAGGSVQPQPEILLLGKNASNQLTTIFSSYISPLKFAILTAIQEAESSISIMTPNLNDADIVAALADAAKCGIKVEIYTGKYHNESTEKYWGGINQTALQNLYQASGGAVEIRWATHDHELIEDGSIYAMHAKFIVIDGRYTITGSSSLDKQALLNSRELDMLFDSRVLANKYLDIFNVKFYSGIKYVPDGNGSSFSLFSYLHSSSNDAEDQEIPLVNLRK